MRRELRKYQKTAVAAIKADMKTNSRGSVYQATGTGKTVVITEVISAAVKRGSSVLVLVPNVGLVTQTAAAIVRDADVNVTQFYTPKVWRSGGRIHTTREAHVVAKHVAQGDVIVSTYQSSYKLAGMHFDLIVFDEAHRAAAPKREKRGFAFCMEDKNVSANYRLFLTATPTFSKSKKLYSMDSIKDFGQVLAQYNTAQAIADTYLSNFDIIGAHLDDAALLAFLGRNAATEADDVWTRTGLRVTVDDVMMAVGVLMTVKDLGSKSVLVYVNEVATAHLLSNLTQYLAKVYKVSMRCHSADANTPEAERERIKGHLANPVLFGKTTPQVVFNVGIFNEGIDVPNLDTVIFAERRMSLRLLIQNVGRALRLREDGAPKVAKIVALSYETGARKYNHETLINTLKALATDLHGFQKQQVFNRLSVRQLGVSTSSGEEATTIAPWTDSQHKAIVEAIEFRYIGKQPQTCTFSGCDKPHKGKGYCVGHLAQLNKAGGDVSQLKAIAARLPVGAPCAHEGCERTRQKGAYCNAHSLHLRRYGYTKDLKGDWTSPKDTPETCTIPGCSNPHSAKGLCNAHYQKARKAQVAA